MKNVEFEAALKALVSTNLGLQNSFGVYSEQISTVLEWLKAQPTRDARLARLESQLAQLGPLLVNIVSKLPVRRKAKRRRK